VLLVYKNEIIADHTICADPCVWSCLIHAERYEKLYVVHEKKVAIGMGSCI